MGRVGLFFQPKKWKKFSLVEFIRKCGEDGIEVVGIDLTKDIESQGPFDIIVHKVVDVLKKAENGDAIAQEGIKKYEDYIASHPEMMVFDSLEVNRKIADRGEQFRISKLCEEEIGKEARFFVPNFVDIRHECPLEELKELLDKGGIRYPFLTKCLVAQGGADSHRMALIFNEDGLADVKTPCLVQNFVNHSAVLFKMYVLGERVFVVVRKSIKNFDENSRSSKSVIFNSEDISKQHSRSELTEVDDGDDSGKKLQPDMERFEKLAKVFRRVAQLECFGVDFCVEDGTGRYAAVDVNLFPGFNGVPGFHELLKEFIVKKMHEKQQQS